MAEQVVSANDSEVWLGWPTEDTGDAYVQLGVIRGDEAAWAQLDSDGIDELRRQLQRAKRRVYGRTDETTTVINVQASGVASTREIVAALERHARERGGTVGLR